MDLMKSITQEYEKTEIPAFGVGDTIKVHIKIKEGNRERIQVFEGFQKTKRRHQRNFHSQKAFFRYRCGKDFPTALTEDRKDRSRKKRRGKKSETELHA